MSSRARCWRGLTGTVLVFGLVSFLTDVSSEMIYPLLPLFVTTVLGAGPALLGVIEGVAESTASLLKLVSGVWSDRVRDRSRLVLGGYSVSSFARPLMAAATHPFHVLALRFADRVGKGIRTSPRDAIIADDVEPAVRGKAFGFQRALDHAGAVAGPLIATLLLARFTKNLRTVFALAGIPAALAVALILWRVRETPRHQPRRAQNLPWLAWPHGPLRRYLVVLFLFTLGNSSDAFLLLRAAQLGVPTAQLPLLWVTLHVVKMLATTPFGALSDQVGRRRMIVAGWAVYALTYVGFAFAASPWHAWMLFAFYGLFYGLTEGVERALVTDLARAGERGGALGWYNGIVGIGALPASVLFGGLWQMINPHAAFLFGAVLAACSAMLLLACIPPATRP